MFFYLFKEFIRIYRLKLHILDQANQVLGHDSIIQSIDHSIFQICGKLRKLLESILLPSLSQSTAPGKDRGYRVSRSPFTISVSVIMSGDSSMSSLVFI